MRDVARAAGVSPATVSNVLNQRRNVHPAIAARVRDAVSSLGYRVDPVAANLRRAQSRLVGLVIPDFQNPFFGELVATLERLAEENGFRLTVVSSREDPAVEAAQVRTLVDWRVAGLIVVPAGATFASRAIIDDAGIRTVIVDRGSGITGFDSVSVDNEAIAFRATHYLHDEGHRRILLAASSTNSPNMGQRIDGALAAADALGIRPGIDVTYCGASVGDTIAALNVRLDQAPLPTAIFALYNTATLASLRVVRQHGLSVPDDMSVIGFDDYDWMQVSDPPVTVVSQPIGEMARSAWRRLMRRMDDDDLKPEQVQIPCSMEIRGSVAPPGAADQTVADIVSGAENARSDRARPKNGLKR